MPIPPGPRTPAFDPPERSDLMRLAALVGRFERPLWCVVVASLVLDALLTGYGLQVGLTEANPIAELLIRRFGFMTALLTLKGVALAVALVGWTLLPRRSRVVVPIGLAVPWCVAVAVNAVALANVVA